MLAKKSNVTHFDWVEFSKTILKFVGFGLVMMVLISVTTAKFQSLRTANFGSETIVTAAERTQQLHCLSQNIYYEAGHESFEGKVAVAQVTMNRVEDGRFGKGVCGVVHQRNTFYEKVICQFSWVCESKSAIKPINSAAYTESEEVAKKVLLEDFRMPSIREAIYYHADYINPGWNKPKITKIGHHIFYKA